MALTLNQAAQLSNDVLRQGVVETIVDASPILQRLPFVEIVGNSLKYNREKTLPDAAFYGVGDTWAEGTGEVETKVAHLSIMGGDADVDRFLARTRSNVQDLEVVTVQHKAKAVQRLYEETFLTGDRAVNPDAFDGIFTAVPNGRRISPGVNGGALTIPLLEQLIDLHRKGAPDLLMMSRRSRRALTALFRAAGSGVLPTERDEFGKLVALFNEVPVVISDFLSDAQTHGSANNASSIVSLRFGEDAVAGLQGDGGLQVEVVGSLETKDATRTRVKWYASLGIFDEDAVGVLEGITG